MYDRPPNLAGEVCGFSPEVAEKLIESKVATEI